MAIIATCTSFLSKQTGPDASVSGLLDRGKQAVEGQEKVLADMRETLLVLKHALKKIEGHETRMAAIIARSEATPARGNNYGD